MMVEADELDTAGAADPGSVSSPCARKPLRLAVEAVRCGPAQEALGSYDLPSEVPMRASEAEDAERCVRERLPLAVGRVDGSSKGLVSGTVGCESMRHVSSSKHAQRATSCAQAGAAKRE